MTKIAKLEDICQVIKEIQLNIFCLLGQVSSKISMKHDLKKELFFILFKIKKYKKQEMLNKYFNRSFNYFTSCNFERLDFLC